MHVNSNQTYYKTLLRLVRINVHQSLHTKTLPWYNFEKQNLISNVLYFKDIHDVEFEVRTGPFPGDNQRCKLTCVKGQWVGPLCRTKESKKPLPSGL